MSLNVRTRYLLLGPELLRGEGVVTPRVLYKGVGSHLILQLLMVEISLDRQLRQPVGLVSTSNSKYKQSHAKL